MAMTGKKSGGLWSPTGVAEVGQQRDSVSSMCSHVTHIAEERAKPGCDCSHFWKPQVMSVFRMVSPFRKSSGPL